MASRNRIDKQSTGGLGIRNPSPPRLVSLKDASDYSGLSVWTLRERIWSGDLPVVRFNGGRKMFIDILDLEDLIARNKARVS